MIVKPANVNQYYGVDGELATYLYSLIETKIFAYENFVPHSIKVNDQEIKHTKGSYTYQSYDLKWHETTIANTEEDVIEINDLRL